MITAFAEPRTKTNRFLADVITGLSAPQKWLSPKYFYDRIGSRLFDRITDLPEYYPTRTELCIMRRAADEMAARCGPRCMLIEFGAGSLVKARLLLDRLDEPVAYVPVDVSGEHLRSAARTLAADYPALEVQPVVADFTRRFTLPELPAARRVVYFPGSTIGNMDAPEADVLLRRIARLVGTDGGLLLGVDLRKDTGVLESAYNDAAGVTAAFNVNVLARINRELDGDFDLSAFRHHAFYNRIRERIEMHLVSTQSQCVRVGGRVFRFRHGETIHTESSHKYNITELSECVAQCGLRAVEWWTDERNYFAVGYLRAE